MSGWMGEDMISVLIPVYNGSEFLNECIESVLYQSFKNIEILIGINGHNDESSDRIINNTIKNDKIKFILFEEASKIKTMNWLASLAKFNYVALLDCDDIWLPNKLEKQIEYIDKYDVVGTDAIYFGEADGLPGITVGEFDNTVFAKHNPMINSSIIMKKIDAVWNEDWAPLEDYQLWIKLIKENKTFYNINEQLVKHRVYNGSFFNNTNDEKAQELRKQYALSIGYKLEERSPEELPEGQ